MIPPPNPALPASYLAKMSSGLSPTAANCGMVAEKALEVYRACKTCADEDYRAMVDNLSSLHLVLIDLRDNLTRDATGLTHTRAETLEKELNVGYAAIKEFQGSVQIFEKMPFANQRRFTIYR